LAGKLAKAHVAHCSGFYFIVAVALESKAALGLAIPYKATAENTTIYKGSGVVSDPSSWDRKLCRGTRKLMATGESN